MEAGDPLGWRAHGRLWPPGGRELPEAGRSQGLLHRCGHGLPEVPERVVQFALDKLGEGRGLESDFVLGFGQDPNWGGGVVVTSV